MLNNQQSATHLTQTHNPFRTGIELDLPFVGKNSGSVGDIPYFSCAPDRGLFVRAAKVRPLRPIQGTATTAAWMVATDDAPPVHQRLLQGARLR